MIRHKKFLKYCAQIAEEIALISIIFMVRSYSFSLNRPKPAFIYPMLAVPSQTLSTVI